MIKKLKIHKKKLLAMGLAFTLMTSPVPNSVKSAYASAPMDISMLEPATYLEEIINKKLFDKDVDDKLREMLSDLDMNYDFVAAITNTDSTKDEYQKELLSIVDHYVNDIQIKRDQSFLRRISSSHAVVGQATIDKGLIEFANRFSSEVTVHEITHIGQKGHNGLNMSFGSIWRRILIEGDATYNQLFASSYEDLLAEDNYNDEEYLFSSRDVHYIEKIGLSGVKNTGYDLELKVYIQLRYLLGEDYIKDILSSGAGDFPLTKMKGIIDSKYGIGSFERIFSDMFLLFISKNEQMMGVKDDDLDSCSDFLSEATINSLIYLATTQYKEYLDHINSLTKEDYEKSKEHLEQFLIESAIEQRLAIGAINNLNSYLEKNYGADKIIDINKEYKISDFKILIQNVIAFSLFNNEVNMLDCLKKDINAIDNEKQLYDMLDKYRFYKRLMIKIESNKESMDLEMLDVTNEYLKIDEIETLLMSKIKELGNLSKFSDNENIRKILPLVMLTSNVPNLDQAQYKIFNSNLGLVVSVFNKQLNYRNLIKLDGSHKAHVLTNEEKKDYFEQPLIEDDIEQRLATGSINNLNSYLKDIYGDDKIIDIQLLTSIIELSLFNNEVNILDYLKKDINAIDNEKQLYDVVDWYRFYKKTMITIVSNGESINLEMLDAITERLKIDEIEALLTSKIKTFGNLSKFSDNENIQKILPLVMLTSNVPNLDQSQYEIFDSSLGLVVSVFNKQLNYRNLIKLDDNHKAHVLTNAEMTKLAYEQYHKSKSK